MGMPNGLHHIALNVHDVEGALEKAVSEPA